MNPLYNSRQRKIYNDYNGWSSEKLADILKNGENYNRDIIVIIEEILQERKVPLPSSPVEIRETESTGKDEDNASEPEKARVEREEKLRIFISGLREGRIEEITEIITKYSFYQPEKVEAALVSAVDRGVISYELRVSLQKQINENLGAHWDRNTKPSWEKENAFLAFVSRYSDEEIYDIIDDPKEIIIDVYHAVILTALNRELISRSDFEEYYQGAKSAMRTEFERTIDEYREESGLSEIAGNPLSDEAVKEEAGRYVVCPNCNELVDAGMSVCWKCEAVMPETAVHPDLEKVRKEMISEQKETIIPPLLYVLFGFIIIFGGSVLRNFLRHGDPFYHKYSLIGLGIFLGGLFLWFVAKYLKIMKD